MIHKYDNKSIVIPDKDIENLMKNLELSKEEAIDLWLCDNNLESDEEQLELDEKASKVKINMEVESKSAKKPRKPAVRKISDEKKELFSEILSDLEDVYKGNVTVLTENKVIEVKIGEKVFKIDVIEHRQPKNKQKSV